MFRVCVLFSGSKGNSTLVYSDNAMILLDAGLSAKRIFTSIQNIGLDFKRLNGIFISHEHSDHISGAGVINRKLKIPIHLSYSTFEECCHKIGKLKCDVKLFNVGEKITVGDLTVTTFDSSHDAIDSCNFIVTQDGNQNQKLALSTDLGFTSKLMLNKLKDVTTLIIESNHDEKLLLQGTYPWELKQRIRSNKGHLSNKQAVGCVSQIMHPYLKNIVLAHLSEENNDPQIAEKEMSSYLDEIKAETNLFVANQKISTPIIDI